MTVISFAQVCLATMIIGIYVFDVKIGSNPFLLTREVFTRMHPDISSARLSEPGGHAGWQRAEPDIAELLDGDPSARTVSWICIHHRSFCICDCGIMEERLCGWTKAALPWSLFSAAILGLGIMMGARWAYESLNIRRLLGLGPGRKCFPGSLAGHGGGNSYPGDLQFYRAFPAAYLFLFSRELYTDTLFNLSHQKRGPGRIPRFMPSRAPDSTGSCGIFCLVFLMPWTHALYMLDTKRSRYIIKEENSYSREFWMFIGSLVFFLSAGVYYYFYFTAGCQ